MLCANDKGREKLYLNRIYCIFAAISMLAPSSIGVVYWCAFNMHESLPVFQFPDPVINLLDSIMTLELMDFLCHGLLPIIPFI